MRVDDSNPDNRSQVKPRRPTEHQLQELVEEANRCLDHLFKIRQLVADRLTPDIAMLKQAMEGVESFVDLAHDPTAWASLLWLGEEQSEVFLIGDMVCHCYHHAVYRLAYATLFVWPKPQFRSDGMVAAFVDTLHARGLVLPKSDFTVLCSKVAGEAKSALKLVRMARPTVGLLQGESEIVALLKQHGGRLGAKEIADKLPGRPEPNPKFRQMLSDLVKRGVLDTDLKAGGYGVVR